MTALSHERQAIITGASSGIGRETALTFAKAGINVALVSRSASSLEDVVQAAQSLGVKAKAYPLDLTHLEEIKPHIANIIHDFGDIDILINNAGMGYVGRLGEMSLEDWQRVIDLNLTSVFLCVQGVLPHMRQRQQGTIVNIASIAAYQTFADWGAYSASKAALVAFSKVLAEEERANALRIFTLSPGAVNTAIWDSETVQVDFDRSQMLTPEVVAQSILQAVLLPSTVVIPEMTILSNLGTL